MSRKAEHPSSGECDDNRLSQSLNADNSLKEMAGTSSQNSILTYEASEGQHEASVPKNNPSLKRSSDPNNSDDDDPPSLSKRARSFQKQSENLLDSERVKYPGGQDSPHKLPPPAPPSTPSSNKYDSNSWIQTNVTGHCVIENSANTPLSETNLGMSLSSEGEGTFSALSSVCSSPLSHPNMSSLSASALNKLNNCAPQNGNALSRENSLTSINSASSTSSASYSIPPAPPSTPVGGLMKNSDPSCDNGEGDIYFARDINTQQQIPQHYTHVNAAGKSRFQDMATPTPNKGKRHRSGAYETLQDQPDTMDENNQHLPDIHQTSSGARAESQRQPHSPTTTSSHHSTETGNSQKDTSNMNSDISDNFSDWKVGPRYKLIRILGQGSYGEVAQARDLVAERDEGGDSSDGVEVVPKYVAIKRINKAFEQEVDALRLYREIHILRRLRGHECIIQLLDIVPPESDNIDEFCDLYLVFEYVDTDLYKLIMSPQYLTTEHIQTFLYQMLTGLKYVHSSSVIHRDLKPANILLNEDCSLKICDFGLARIVNSETVAKGSEGNNNTSDGPNINPKPRPELTRQLTKHVVTRWYRAPELILIQPYTSAVDIWSLGCILAELLSMQEGNVPGYQDRVPLFPGGSCYPLSGEGDSVKKDERLDQLSVILGVIGTPSPEDVESVGNANYYIKSLTKQPSKSLESLYPAANRAVIDLLKMMLQFNPKKRCTTEEALEHEFLSDVRRKEMERTVNQPLIGPQFLNSNQISLEELKRRTFEEVMLERKSKLSASPK